MMVIGRRAIALPYSKKPPVEIRPPGGLRLYVLPGLPVRSYGRVWLPTVRREEPAAPVERLTTAVYVAQRQIRPFAGSFYLPPLARPPVVIRTTRTAVYGLVVWQRPFAGRVHLPGARREAAAPVERWQPGIVRPFMAANRWQPGVVWRPGLLRPPVTARTWPVLRPFAAPAPRPPAPILWRWILRREAPAQPDRVLPPPLILRGQRGTRDGRAWLPYLNRSPVAARTWPMVRAWQQVITPRPQTFQAQLILVSREAAAVELECIQELAGDWLPLIDLAGDWLPLVALEGDTCD